MWPYNEHETDWLERDGAPDLTAVPRMPSRDEIEYHIARGKRLQALAVRAMAVRAIEWLRSSLRRRSLRLATRRTVARHSA